MTDIKILMARLNAVQFRNQRDADTIQEIATHAGDTIIALQAQAAAQREDIITLGQKLNAALRERDAALALVTRAQEDMRERAAGVTRDNGTSTMAAEKAIRALETKTAAQLGGNDVFLHIV